MSRKRGYQLISIAFLVVGLLLSVPGTDWGNTNSTLAFISFLLGTLGSVLSIFIPSNYTFLFTNKDWVDNKEGELHLLISASKHGQGTSPTAQVFLKEGDHYQEVITDLTHTSKGDVIVKVNALVEMSMNGKVIIS
jgi:hypothetical protein